MTLIDHRIRFGLWSRADGNRLGPMRTAVSIAVRTAIGDEVNYSTVSKAVKGATVKLVARPEVVSTIAGGLSNTDEFMSSIARFVVGAVRKKRITVDYIKKEPKVEVIPLSTPSSDPSDSDSFRMTRMLGRDRLAGRKKGKIDIA